MLAAYAEHRDASSLRASQEKATPSAGPKVSRDRYRQTTPLTLRRLERNIAHLEHHAADRMAGQASLTHEHGPHLQERLTLARNGLEGTREHLQQRLWEAIHRGPPESPEAQDLAEETRTIMRASLQQLERRVYRLD